MKFVATAQAAPLPPKPGGKSIRLPQGWGAGGHSGRYRDHSHCLAEQLQFVAKRPDLYHESKPFVKISEIRGKEKPFVKISEIRGKKKPIRGRRTIQSHSMKDQLLTKIHDHTAVVAVIGLG